MSLSQNILTLRKQHGLSQEDLAEKMAVSRQTISRWELGTSAPTLENVVQLSKLFQVSTDFLLDNAPETAAPSSAPAKSGVPIAFLAILEGMAVVLQLVCLFVLQNEVLTALSILPMLGLIAGFEFAWHRHPSNKSYRLKFYKITVWFANYLPVRLFLRCLMTLYPRPYSPLVLEAVIVLVYILISTTVNAWLSHLEKAPANM